MKRIKKYVGFCVLVLTILVSGAKIYASQYVYFSGLLPSYQGWAYTGAASKTSSTSSGEVTVTALGHEGVTFYAYADGTGHTGEGTTIYQSSVNDTKPLYYDAIYGVGQSMICKYRNTNWMVFQKTCNGYVDFY